MNSEEVGVIAFIKGEERYIFVFNEESRPEVFRTFERKEFKKFG